MVARHSLPAHLRIPAPVADALLACLTPGAERAPGEPLDEGQAAELIALGGERLKPLLGYRLQGRLPPSAGQRLAQELRLNLVRNLSRVAELSRLSAAFAGQGLEMISLKGMHLALVAYPHLGVRFMRDLDILVRPEAVVAAQRLLESLGYRPTGTGDPDAFMQVTHHFHPYVHGKTSQLVELHWALGGSLHRLDDGHLKEVWLRAETLPLPGRGTTLVMAPEHLAAFVLLHASHQHLFEFGPLLLADMAGLLAATADRLDWSEFVRCVRRWRCSRGAYLGLRSCRDLLEVAVPEEVLADLRPPEFEESWLRVSLELALAVPERRGVRVMDRLLTAQGWRERWRILRGTVVRDPILDQVQYRLSPESAGRRLRYVRRVADLARRYWRVFLYAFRPASRRWRRRAVLRGRLAAWLREDFSASRD
ncbi:MAG: hypothetical protein Kow001_13450 [Acidobacteriota bacterium]